MSFPDDTTTICTSGDYRMVQIFDMAQLTWPEGSLVVGDHCYTDPQCAVINETKGWCVSGGQGLEICLFEDGLPHGPDTPDFNRIKWQSLWRNENPPPDGARYWFVANIWLYEDDLVRVVVNPLGEA